jgi:hypothetical protein
MKPMYSYTYTSNIQYGLAKYALYIYLRDTFQTRKGLRQGNHVSQLLFSIVADMLAILLIAPRWWLSWESHIQDFGSRI